MLTPQSASGCQGTRMARLFPASVISRQRKGNASSHFGAALTARHSGAREAGPPPLPAAGFSRVDCWRPLQPAYRRLRITPAGAVCAALSAASASRFRNPVSQAKQPRLHGSRRHFFGCPARLDVEERHPEFTENDERPFGHQPTEITNPDLALPALFIDQQATPCVETNTAADLEKKPLMLVAALNCRSLDSRREGHQPQQCHH